MNELTTVEQQEMQRSSGVVMPVASPEEMHNAMVLYQRMKEAVLDPTDYQDAGRGQRFVKKSGWAKLAIAFGVSSEIIDERYERDEAGDLLRARFKVRAIAPNGRYAEGFGVCDIKEERFTHGKDHPKGWWKAGDPNNRDKIEHDLPSTAETRARNRAYSALFGHGEVSYEEVQANGSGDVADAEIIAYESSPRSEIPKASPYKPASANQLATFAKLSRLLGRPEEPSEDWTSAEVSDRITELSREYNERKSGTPARERERYTQAQRDATPDEAKAEAARAQAKVQEALRETERPDDAEQHGPLDRQIQARMLQMAQRDQMELTDIEERVLAAGGVTGSIKKQPLEIKRAALDWLTAALAPVPA